MSATSETWNMMQEIQLEIQSRALEGLPDAKTRHSDI